MPYSHMVCLDVDEMGGVLKDSQIMWVTDPSRIEQAVKHLSISWPNSTILIFELKEIQKLKTPPTYARYVVNPHGEIIPK